MPLVIINFEILHSSSFKAMAIGIYLILFGTLKSGPALDIVIVYRIEDYRELRHI